MTYYVNAYETRLVYGGPEEGGWWFDTGTPTGQSWGPFATLEEAWDQQAALAENVNEWNEGRWPKHSVNSDGRYELHVEGHEPREYPERSPRYE